MVTPEVDPGAGDPDCAVKELFAVLRVACSEGKWGGGQTGVESGVDPRCPGGSVERDGNM